MSENEVSVVFFKRSVSGNKIQSSVLLDKVLLAKLHFFDVNISKTVNNILWNVVRKLEVEEKLAKTEGKE